AKNSQDAGRFLGRARVKVLDTALGNAAEHEHAVSQIGDFSFGSVASAARDLEPPVHTVERPADGAICFGHDEKPLRGPKRMGTGPLNLEVLSPVFLDL